MQLWVGGFRFVASGSLNHAFIVGTESLSVCADDLFVLISAYFLAITQERKFIKVVELIVQVIVFRILEYVVVSVLIDGYSFSIQSLFIKFFPANYFVILYVALYIISPYINMLLKKLSKNMFLKLLITLVIIFSVWSIIVDYCEQRLGSEVSSLSPISAWGSGQGYTIVNFLLIYCLGAYIQIHGIRMTKKKAGLGILGCFIALYVSYLVEHHFGLIHYSCWNYNSPLVIFLAIFVFMFFKKIDFRSKVVNELAKAAFTCFLVHIPLLKYLRITTAVQTNLLFLILHYLASIVLLYILSYLIYKVYYLCSRWFFKLITPACEKINISVHEEKLEN